MIATVGIISVLGGLVYFYSVDDVRALHAAIASYLLTGILFQRREGQLSARSGPYYYRHCDGYSRRHIPDPAVTWDWRLRVAAFWLPWLVMVRIADVIVFATGGAGYLWRFAVLGHEEPKRARWRTRRRVFRSLPGLIGAEESQTEGRITAASAAVAQTDPPAPAMETEASVLSSLRVPFPGTGLFRQTRDRALHGPIHSR